MEILQLIVKWPLLIKKIATKMLEKIMEILQLIVKLSLPIKRKTHQNVGKNYEGIKDYHKLKLLVVLRCSSILYTLRY